jgi:hypothetical protein
MITLSKPALELNQFETCLAMKDLRSAAGYDGMAYGILQGFNEDLKNLFFKFSTNTV